MNNRERPAHGEAPNRLSNPDPRLLTGLRMEGQVTFTAKMAFRLLCGSFETERLFAGPSLMMKLQQCRITARVSLPAIGTPGRLPVFAPERTTKRPTSCFLRSIPV